MATMDNFIVEASTSEKAVIVKEDGRFFILAAKDIWIPFWRPVVLSDIELTLPDGMCALVIHEGGIVCDIVPGALRHKMELKYKRPFLFRHFKRGDKLGHLLIINASDVFFIGLQETIDGGIITMEV